MPNTSATGGYLTPASTPAPLEDVALQNFLQEVVVGVTGMAAAMVRPRWQAEPPNQPDFGDNWAAIGVINSYPDTYAVTYQDEDETQQLQRHETVELLASFYGPNANRNLGILRDGLQLAQNRDALVSAGFNLKETGHSVPAPELVKGRWLNRVDLPITFRRIILRSYPVLTLVSASGTIHNEHYDTPFTVEEPTP